MEGHLAPQYHMLKFHLIKENLYNLPREFIIMKVKVRVKDSRLEISNLSDTPLKLLDVIIKYRVHVSTIEDGSAIKYVTQKIPINQEIIGFYEMPIHFPDVSEVTVIYKVGNEKVQETVSL